VRFRECSTSSTRFNLCENCYNTTTIVGIVIPCIAGAIIAWTIQQNWTAHPGMLFLSLLLPLLFLVPGITNIIQGMQMYRFAQSLRNATAVAEAPILDVWQDEGFEGEPYIVAWELTVIDRIRKNQTLPAGAEDRQGALRLSPDARDSASALCAGST